MVGTGSRQRGKSPPSRRTRTGLRWLDLHQEWALGWRAGRHSGRLSALPSGFLHTLPASRLTPIDKAMLNNIVKRPLLWVMLYGALIAYGIYALINIHSEVLPQFNMPQVSIIAQLPGATTLDLEGLIARPVEAELTSLQSLSDVRTVVTQGSVKIEVRFAEGTTAARALQDVNGVVGRINGALPKGTSLTTEISGNAINEVA